MPDEFNVTGIITIPGDMAPVVAFNHGTNPL
mgnify:FL=1